MPPRLREAGGNYEVESPPDRACPRDAGSVGLFPLGRAVEPRCHETQDPSIMDRVDNDAAAVDVAQTMGCLSSWPTTDRSLQRKLAPCAGPQEQIAAAPRASRDHEGQAAQVKAGMVSPQGGRAGTAAAAGERGMIISTRWFTFQDFAAI